MTGSNPIAFSFATVSATLCVAWLTETRTRTISPLPVFTLSQ